MRETVVPRLRGPCRAARRLCWRLKYPRDGAHEQQLEHTLAWLNRLPEQSDTAPLYELLASKA